jgi:RNA polymerase sigma-70 factor, ECF subfamily
MDPIDQALQRTRVLKCQLGDRRALAELYLRHSRPLRYYLRRVLGRDDVEDVQQDVWLAVIRKLPRLRAPEAFVVWLYQIARRKALDRLADHRRAAPLAGRAGGDDAPIDPAAAAAAAADAESEFSPEDAARIHEALASVSPGHREVLTLRFMEDLSYDQIADVIGCAPGTVRSRLHYAKLALKQRLERCP